MSILSSITDVLRTRNYGGDGNAILLAQGISPDTGGGSMFGDLGQNTYSKQFENYVSGEISGTLDMAGFNAAKGYELQRMGDRNELAEKFGKDSEIYNMQLMQQAQASETFMNRLGQIDARLGEIKTGSYGSASQATSKRQYAQLSQQAMQGTARYLAELERFQAPQSADIDFTFADPITGKKLDIGTAFEDVYAEGTAPGDAARSMVMADFARIRDEKANEARSALTEQFGAAEDYWKDLEGFGVQSNEDYLEYLQRGISSTSEALYNRMTPDQRRSSNQPWARNLLLRDQFMASMAIEDTVTDYSEAAALAQMGGYTDSFEGGTARFQYDPISLFYQQDVNSVLDDMVGKTTERLDIARMTERADVEKEFNRRQEAAVRERSLFDSQLQRNQEHAERIEAEKQATRMRMEQQKREYAESMSSFSTGPVDGGSGITFNETRPQ